MTPDQIAGLTAVAAIVSKIGTWPIGSLVAIIVLGPWAVMGWSIRSMELRHKAQVQMYQDNVKLVVSWENMSKDQADTIRLTTAAITELTMFLKRKTPCHERIKEILR